MRESKARRRMGAAWTALALFVSVILVPSVQPVARAASPALGDVLADFEGGVPAGWFAFAGSSTVSTTSQVVGDAEALAVPGQVGDNEILDATFNVTDFGGFGDDLVTTFAGPQDWRSYGSFDFWFYGTGSGLAYQAEISDNRGDPAIDTSERFDYEFTDSTPGWQYFSIPFEDFTRATDFQPGGAPNDGFTLSEIWAWAIVLPVGADTVYFDDVGLGPKVIDDFESGLPSGADGDGVPIGFYTFQGAGSSITLFNPGTPPAPPLPVVGTPNSTLQMEIDSTSFAGFIHGFENPAVDTWVTQDWSTSEGISMWFYGTGSGSSLFIDILDNRNPGSTTDDAERWTVPFVDDFSGWQLLEFPFSSFARKEVGNGAPNDGLGLFEMHGYALGALGTGGPRTYYVDEVSLYGVAEPPALSVSFALIDTPIEEGTTGDVVVKLNRPFNADDPAQVSVDFATEIAGAIAGEEYTPTSGTLTFVNGGPTELTFPIETFDDTKFEGEERIVLRLSNPVDVELGSTQARALIVDSEAFDPLLLDDFEKGAFLWETDGPATVGTERAEGASARPGQDAVESVLVATVPLNVDIDVKGNLCRGSGNGVVPVHLLSTSTFDATTVDHTTVTFGGATETHVDRRTGEARRHVEDVNDDGADDLVFHFRRGDIGGGCEPSLVPLNGATFGGQGVTTGGSDAGFSRDFALGEDWTGTESLSFWYYGSGGGEPVTVTLKDNLAAEPGVGTEMVWSDEFNDPAGTLPNPDNWGYEIGDGALNGIEGWGNSELQYYTDDPANAAMDGDGNLVITLDEADGSQECFYGTCEFTSARLVSKDRAEFAYGRIESRLRVPDGGAGLWPAFWSLGTDITYNPWPAAGEIDFMEYVSRIPNEIFGTIHGPGYNGGSAFGNIYDFGEPVYNQYHTFVTEWEPDLITWYVDGIQYHQAEPVDVPGPWVFEKPFYLLLNFAIGGNFGGEVDPTNTYPQKYLVDYVRVYQGADTAERFEASFVDDFTGWQQVTVPVTDFVRSTDQPDGAPNDGLGLDEVWGYGFELPEGNTSGELKLDFIQRNLVPPPTELTVANLDDSGTGSLREALSLIADNGTITFDPALAGGTIGLDSGQLVVDRSVNIDASAAPGLVVSGSNASRVFQIEPSVSVSMNDLEIADGAAALRGGGILNLGTLNLERVVVRDNTENSAGPANFEFGGGGIYNGADSALNLTDSTVSNNTSVNHPAGGVYGFFGSTINITRSTVSGNLSGDVAGGLRSLGNTTVVNSTFSDNTSTAWHGGAMFLTDGAVTISNSTIVGNNAPSGTAGGLMVATFGAPVNVTIADNIIADNGTYNCQLEGGAAAVLTSLGGNVNTDGSCAPIGTDQIVSAGGASVDALADNGGPTLTHALLPGSPAIDAAVGGCPATDQRGVARPQGAGCDVGGYELVP